MTHTNTQRKNSLETYIQKNKEKLPTRKCTLRKECIKKIANTFQGMHIKTKTIHKKNKRTHTLFSLDRVKTFLRVL